MSVSVRELRNQGGHVLDRVARGEALRVSRDGVAVAELRPIRRRSLPTAELIARSKQLSPVDPQRLRDDIDAILDQSL
jgi:prevent-host-death family protein